MQVSSRSSLSAYLRVVRTCQQGSFIVRRCECRRDVMRGLQTIVTCVRISTPYAPRGRVSQMACGNYSLEARLIQQRPLRCSPRLPEPDFGERILARACRSLRRRATLPTPTEEVRPCARLQDPSTLQSGFSGACFTSQACAAGATPFYPPRNSSNSKTRYRFARLGIHSPASNTAIEHKPCKSAQQSGTATSPPILMIKQPQSGRSGSVGQREHLGS